MYCKNCNTTLIETDSFCNSCGAKVIRNRLTIKNLFEHFSEQFLNYDNKFIQTFIHLFTKPEKVINGYIDGVRKKYINPISFLAISLTLSGIYFFFFKEKFSELLNTSDLYVTDGQQKLTVALTNFSTEYNSIIYFVIIPVLALISLVVFYNKKYNFTEHTVIYLYSMSLSSMVSIVSTVFILLISSDNYLLLSSFIYVFMFIYHGYILKRIFQLNAKQLAIKTLIFIPLFFIVYLIGSVIITLIVILTGDFSIKDFVPKK